MAGSGSGGGAASATAPRPVSRITQGIESGIELLQGTLRLGESRDHHHQQGGWYLGLAQDSRPPHLQEMNHIRDVLILVRSLEWWHHAQIGQAPGQDQPNQEQAEPSTQRGIDSLSTRLESADLI